MSNLIDLTGKRFGKLVVLQRGESAPSGKVKWLCQCDCGNQVLVMGLNLSRSHTISCGCYQSSKIKIGQRYGLLTVQDKIKEGKKTYAICLCDCGRSTRLRVDSLLGDNGTKSCGHCGYGVKERVAASHAANFYAGTQVTKIKDIKLTKANKSGVVGVNWDKSRNLWQASIRFKGKKYNLGRFADFDDAVAARQAAEKEIFGEFLEFYNALHDKNDK